ncbi:gfo/Idh/MocA family oxidoreductase [Cohnella endophytica]|uniref:Gfo/Idh/MocA family oxidoreductase n=1 Tax=Cohnella endophytica TaxID=2419778 RepID=A0A494XTW6_9BACL|nr:Gfo/Idh/MocA family oxidoreductase [Cohnella endophytica]RKP53111.1 gfo/Idh/MocA family oxidoreductase [Cohnella endophytica]
MKEIRLGLIGLGGMANVHAEQLEGIEGASITAICDRDPERVAEWGTKLGIDESARYSEPEELIRNADVDGVLSITPNNAHYEILRLCLLHGMPIMTEKPFTRTFEEAEALLELSNNHDTTCMLGFSYRYTPSFRMAREMIRDGKIGTVRHVFLQYLQQWGGPLFQTKMNWRMDKSITGTGTLGDLGSHMIDAARFLIGEPIEVSALMSSLITEREDPVTGAPVPVDIDDFAAFVAVLEPGVPAVFQTSRNAYGSQNQFEISVYGDTGSLRMGWEYGETLHWTHPDDQGAEVREQLQVPDAYKLKQMQDFVDLLRGQSREETATLRDGYRNQRALEAVVQAYESKKAVTVDEVGGKAETTIEVKS